jgi:polyferredoxin
MAGQGVNVFQTARAILHDRAARRRVLGWLLMIAVGMLATGLWFIPGWLQQSLLRFAFWWLACGLVTLMLLLFALYDALAVVREEKRKAFGDKDSSRD